MSGQHLFSVFDSAAGAFLPPFTCPSIGLATRLIAVAGNTEGHDFKKWPTQYELFELGTFEPETGQINVHHMQSLGTVCAIVRRIERETAMAEEVQA